MKLSSAILICATFFQIVFLTLDAQQQTRELSSLVGSCPQNKYGVFCYDSCYCKDGDSCDRTNGHCPNGCKGHYKSPICDVCEDGYFGADCDRKCHCLYGASDCDSNTGRCMRGKCEVGYEGDECQILTETLKLSDAPIITKSEKNEIGIEWFAWDGNETEVQPEYKVFYRLKTENKKWSEFGEWQRETSSTITNLEPDSDYEIYVRVRKERREGPIGPIATARTKCGILMKYAKPQKLTIRLRSNTSAAISWEPAKIGCRIVNYTLAFKRIRPFNTFAYNLSGNTVGFSISGLKLNTGYLVNLTAVTSLNETYNYSQTFFNTSNFPQDEIMNNSLLQLILVDDKQVMLAPTRQLVIHDDEYVTYNILITLKSKIACGKIIDQKHYKMVNMTVDEIITISDLSPYSVYEFSIEIEKANGFNKTVVLKANTTEAAPSAGPTNLMTKGDKNTLSFQWYPIPCDEANGQLAYRYSLREFKETLEFANGSKIQELWTDVVTKDTRATFENLTPNTTYEFLVKGFTSAGEGPATIKKETTADNLSRLRPSSKANSLAVQVKSTCTFFLLILFLTNILFTEFK